MFSPELLTYLESPTTVCTLFAPSNQAMSTALSVLGQYSGLVLGNETMRNALLNYHIVPGQKLKAEDMGTKVNSVKTKEGEPLYFALHGGVPYVAFSREYIQPIKVANIQAGTCVVHIVGDTLMAPPSLMPTIQGWLTEAGNPTALQGPKALWMSDIPFASGDSASTAAATTDTADAKTLDSSTTPTERVQPESGTQQQKPAVSGASESLKSGFVLFAATAAWLLVLFAL
eukprot:GHUV01008613.1.p1 GENE.GHUV01008613.1~~GHUV01008613.1.p1  ORF type:complete len:230 (+),score=51.52 GHUV01008613.1:946-1635(+)